MLQVGNFLYKVGTWYLFVKAFILNFQVPTFFLPGEAMYIHSISSIIQSKNNLACAHQSTVHFKHGLLDHFSMTALVLNTRESDVAKSPLCMDH